MVSNNAQGEMKQRQSLEAVVNQMQDEFDFDRWAVAVRRQMLAALKKREGHRSSWS